MKLPYGTVCIILIEHHLPTTRVINGHVLEEEEDTKMHCFISTVLWVMNPMVLQRSFIWYFDYCVYRSINETR